jgi:hypothetical protein
MRTPGADLDLAVVFCLPRESSMTYARFSRCAHARGVTIIRRTSVTIELNPKLLMILRTRAAEFLHQFQLRSLRQARDRRHRSLPTIPMCSSLAAIPRDLLPAYLIAPPRARKLRPHGRIHAAALFALRLCPGFAKMPARPSPQRSDATKLIGFAFARWHGTASRLTSGQRARRF